MLGFSMTKFIDEFEEAMSRFDDPSYFDISPQYSVVYHDFLEKILPIVRQFVDSLKGQSVLDSIFLIRMIALSLFDENIRPFMLEFMAKRINVQLARLKKRNENAFMFIDEPGLQFIFSAMSGYGEHKAKDGPRCIFCNG